MRVLDFIKVFLAAMVVAAGVSAQIDWDETIITIRTAEELKEFATVVNAGNDFEGKTVKLGNSIDLNGNEDNQWTPIGIIYDNSFAGTFDGAGFVISGVYINNTNNQLGLFGDVNYGTIINLGVVDSYVKGNDDVGLLLGYGEAYIINCYATGNVEGNNAVGGLVGKSYGATNGCYFIGNVAGKNRVGGLVGELDDDGFLINNCYTVANITGERYIGDIVGISEGIPVTSCYYNKEINEQIQVWGYGKTTAQMKQQNTYFNWDFQDIWAINPEINNGYPYLRVFGTGAGNTPIEKTAANKAAASISFAGITNGQINLNLKAGAYTAQLYNVQGRLIKSVDINAANGITPTGLRIDNLSKGMFILNVKQAGVSVLKHKIAVE